jgi:multidrug efflux pump subunit AcrA (membrane-fusion protein)
MSYKTLEEIKSRPYSESMIPLHERAQADRAWDAWLGQFTWLRSRLAIGALVAGVVAAAWLARGGKSVGAPAAIQPAETLRSVKVAAPAPAANGEVVLPATLQPWQTTSLSARVSGYLTAWHRDLGSHVQAGELLAEIETPELDQELAEGESLASEARAAVVQAQAELAEAQSDLRVTEAQLDRAVAQTELAKSQLARREKLLATRAVSQEDYDTFKTEVDARSADVAAARADVARRRTSLDTRSAVIAAREATARSRESNVERLRELQGFKRITAPFNGVITRRSAEVGMLVTAGKDTLFTVEDMSKIRVRVQVPQTNAAETRPGTQARIVLPESSRPAVESRVTRTAASVDPTNRTMLAEIELENADEAFQPGSYAKVTLATSQSGSQWTIPTNTLSMRIDGPHVAVVNEQDQLELIPVRLGRDLGSRVVVTEGIRGAERLVVNPSDDLMNGVKVRVGGSVKAIAKK